MTWDDEPIVPLARDGYYEQIGGVVIMVTKPWWARALRAMRIWALERLAAGSSVIINVRGDGGKLYVQGSGAVVVNCADFTVGI